MRAHSFVTIRLLVSFMTTDHKLCNRFILRSLNTLYIRWARDKLNFVKSKRFIVSIFSVI